MSFHQFDVSVVGAGLAGLAAASALSRSGAKVALIERKPFFGGRAYSYLHPAVEEVIDSQHVMVGCCTNLRHLCEVAGVADRIRWYDGYTFLEPGGRRSLLVPGVLPSPAHSSLSFLSAPMLRWADKAAIAKGLLQFLRGYPEHDNESVASWLKRSGQTQRAIRHFWQPVIVGALNDSFERCSVKYAGQVFHETFLRSTEGGQLGIPREPLSDFYSAVATDAEKHGAILLKGNVMELRPEGDGWRVIMRDEPDVLARAVVLAVSFEHVPAFLTGDVLHRALPNGLHAFQHSPITTVHLWYDREITELEHAVLLDTTIEWMFHKSKIRGSATGSGSYLELTISASHAQLKQSREHILSSALQELAQFFPHARTARLLKGAVLKEAKATFSVVPGLDEFRPAQKTGVPGLFFAGDWTRTGWPSTMEGAVRSGYLAAEAVTSEHARSARFLQPDLPASGLMKFLARQ